MKYKTGPHLKRGLWTTGQQSSSSSPSPGKTPLTTTVAKFLDTSVCGGSWCLDSSLSPFLVKFTQILESILLDKPHKAAFLSVGCASFSCIFFFHTFCFHSTFCLHAWIQHSVNSQLFWQCMFVAYPREGCQWLSSGQLSDQQSSSWVMYPSEPNWETILKAQETFAGVLSWFADWHVTIICREWIGGFLVHFSQNHYK